MAVSEPTALPISRLQLADAEAVWPLSIEAGWNQISADWRLMIASGSAFGIRDAAGKWVASALAFPLGPAIAWISMVLVTKSERGKGVGTRLLLRCMAEIDKSGAAMGLDATEFGRPIYLPLGFRDVYPLSRWSADKDTRVLIQPPPGIVIKPARVEDLKRIAEYDCKRSGFQRFPVLHDLLARAPEVAHLAELTGGGLAGYSLGRDGHHATHIGPVAADDEAIGLALASHALARAGRAAIIDMPDRHGVIREWLTSQGASAPRRFTRMLRGRAPAVESGSHIFALAGPELA
jgi:GNAT superfamily N-acetyltransferase